MNYDNKVIASNKRSTIKSIVSLIDAINEVPLDDNGQSDTFTLDDGTEVTLSYQIEGDTSRTVLLLGTGDVKYTIIEEKSVNSLKNDR